MALGIIQEGIASQMSCVYSQIEILEAAAAQEEAELEEAAEQVFNYTPEGQTSQMDDIMLETKQTRA
jgi:hypothetical protein